METTTITFRTTEDIKKILDNMALEENKTLSNLIETIILKYLESQKNKASCLILFLISAYYVNFAFGTEISVIIIN